MFNFIIKGYPFTAFLLFFLYCFHGQARTYYYSLARAANVLLWLFLFGSLMLILYVQLSFQVFFSLSIFRGLRKMVGSATLTYAILPYLIIFIALLFKKVRKQAVWILLPLALLVRPALLFGDFLTNEAYTALLLDSLLFLLLTIVITYLVTSAKENIAKENTRLPDRI